MRARLGGFGFGQEKALFPVGELSGGERARLNLALVTHDAPSLLILDEPTNHLDMETREALVAAIAEYSGAVVLVSHDWHLVELVADRLWLVEGGTVRPFDDDLEAYRRQLLSREDAAPERGNGSVELPATRAAPPGATPPNAEVRSNRCAASRAKPSRRRPGSRPSSLRSTRG